MSMVIRGATVMAALVFLANAHPALAAKGGTPTASVGPAPSHGTVDVGSNGGGSGDPKGTPAPVTGLGIGALAALGYFARRLRSRKGI